MLNSSSHRVAIVLGAAKDISIDLCVPAIVDATRLVLGHHLLILSIPDYVLWRLQCATHNAVKFHSAASLDKALLIANEFRFWSCIKSQ